MNEMANGNYAVRTEHTERYVGEFSKLIEAIRGMNRQVDSTIRHIEEAAEQVSAGSGNLADAAQALAEGATDQAAAVEELQATFANITEGVHVTAKHVEDSYQQAQKYADVADNSHNEMNSMISAMTKLSDTSKKIESIISEIEDIASQTNLLSLNAAIEAARAGEAGKGFAVVASEIQKLSSQSDSTASKIQEIITDLQNDSKETLEVMRSTEVLVREQYEKLAATKERFKEVGNGINVSKHGTDVIKGNAQVCDSSRVTVVDVISNLSAISEENAASTQQTTSSMQELNATINILAETAAKVKEVSDQLNEDMKYFKM